MHRNRLLRSAVRALVAVFACVQLSPGALAWCVSADGGVGIGCACNCTGSAAIFMAHESACDDACCGSLPAADADCSQACTTSGCGLQANHPGDCCKHLSIDYNASAAQAQLAAPTLLAVHDALGDHRSLLVSELAIARPPVPLPPDLSACPIASGVSLLPLRI